MMARDDGCDVCGKEVKYIEGSLSLCEGCHIDWWLGGKGAVPINPRQPYDVVINRIVGVN